MMARLAQLLEKLTPHGGLRCIPVGEYLEGRAGGRMDVERRFFAGLQMRNGVYRTTEPHRMDDLLPLLVARALELESRPLRILDVACSAGVATVELHRALVAAGIGCETWGTDLMIRAEYVRRDDGVGVLFDPDHQVLQIDIGRWATPWKWRPRDLAFRPLRSLRARRLISNEIDTFCAALRESVPGYRTSVVPLISSLADSAAGVHFAEEDILAPRVAGRFALIRAANILNRGYFTPAEIRRMAGALCGRLEEGGLLLVVRTVSPQPGNVATLFRRRNCTLSIEEHVRGGSDVAAIVAGAA
ncbi:MAG TPA: hypothetical protein VGK89_07320 [Candidatus Eisenbacteria bacterium]|jgi:hypothetical protein